MKIERSVAEGVGAAIHRNSMVTTANQYIRVTSVEILDPKPQRCEEEATKRSQDLRPIEPTGALSGGS